MTMFTYLYFLVRFAFQKSVLLSDRVSVVVGVLTPAILFVAGPDMQDAALTLITWFIVLTVGLGIILRLLAAPYFIWRADQKEIRRLSDALYEPGRQRQIFFQERFLEDRMNLAKDLSQYGMTMASPLDFHNIDPQEHINALARGSIFFLGDQIFRLYWDTFCSALRNVCTGSAYLQRYKNAISTDHITLLNDRLDYDFQAMKAAATSMTFMLTENYEHNEVSATTISDLNKAYPQVTEDDHPASLWTPPESQSIPDTPEVK